MDDDTYFESLEYHHQRLADVAQHLAKTRERDLLMIETHTPDYTSHFFLSQADEISGGPPKTIQRCRDGVIRTYASVDRMIGRLVELADNDTVVLVYSDHAVSWDNVYIPGWQPMSPDKGTIAEALVHQGYHTGFFGDVPHYFVPGMNFTRGFR